MQVGGCAYNLYYEGSNLQMVAWFEHGAVYWIRNSLTDQVPNGDMLAIAEQTTSAGAARGHLHLKGAGIPTQPTPAKKTGTMATVGSIGGLLTLVAIPLFAFLVLRRRRELTGVKTQLTSGLQRGARLPAAPVPFAPGSAAARAAERARLAAQAGPEPRVPPEVRRREAEHRLTVRRRAVRLGVLVAVIAAAAVAFVITQSGGSAPSRKSTPPRFQATALPTVQVAVSTRAPSRGRQRPSETNFGASMERGDGWERRAGASRGAIDLVRTRTERAGLAARASALGAAADHRTDDPATAAAAGSGAQLVVVIG